MCQYPVCVLVSFTWNKTTLRNSSYISDIIHKCQLKISKCLLIFLKKPFSNDHGRFCFLTRGYHGLKSDPKHIQGNIIPFVLLYISPFTLLYNPYYTNRLISPRIIWINVDRNEGKVEIGGEKSTRRLCGQGSLHDLLKCLWTLRTITQIGLWRDCSR